MIFPIVRLLTHAAWIFRNLFFLSTPIFMYSKPVILTFLRSTKQRRSQNEAEEAIAPPEKTCWDFSLVFYIISTVFENKRKEQSDSCSVVFSHWPRFNVNFCDWVRNYVTKACNFVSKVANQCGQHELRCSLNETQGRRFLAKEYKFRWDIFERIICMKHCWTK